MDTNDPKATIAKLQEELKALKESEPEVYLDLLKTLNEGIAKINAELDKAAGK